MDVVGLIGVMVVYGLLLTAFVAIVVCAGTLLVYIGEVMQDRVIEPWRTRHVRRRLAKERRIPRRDMRHLPH